MTRSLGSASSIPREGTPQTPAKEAARGGEAEPNDWTAIFMALADRLVEWHEAVLAENATIVFDSDDQARLA